MGEGRGGLPAGHHRALPLGIQALRRSRHRADRLVCPHDRGSLGLAGAARLPGRRRRRLAHHGLARWAEARRAPGRLHAVRVRADAARASGSEAAPDPPGRRRGPRVQARRQAGLRQRARHLADAVPGGARKGRPGRPAFHARPRRTEGDGGGRPARGRAAGPDAPPGLQDGRRGRGGAPDPARRHEGEVRRRHSRATSMVARGSVPLRGRREPDRRRTPSGRGQHLFRHAQDLGREPARHRPPLRRAQRRARVPPAHARPGLPSRRLLHVSERPGPPGRGAARPADRPERPARAREDRIRRASSTGPTGWACSSWPTCPTRGASPRPRCGRRSSRRCAG